MQGKIIVWAFLSAGLAAAQVSHVVEPGTRVVDPLNDPPYASWATAATNIQEAVDAAAGQGWTNVWVSNGTYYLTSQVSISAPMTVRSWNNGALDRDGTVVDGNYPDSTNRCFWLGHAQTVLRGFTITRGYVSGSTYVGYGGGVYVTNAILDDCLIISNQASYGGGVYVRQGLVTNCVITTNIAFYSSGGGAMVGPDGIMTDTLVSNNYASSYGGGVYADGAGIVTGCVVGGNTGGTGGGIYARYGASIADTEILDNTAGSGGGLEIDDAVARGCLVSDNTSTSPSRGSNRGGAGVRLWANALVEDGIIRNNNAYGVGGGVNVCGGVVRNCLIVGNIAEEGSYAGAGVFYYQPGLVENCRIVSNTSPSQGGGVTIWDQSGAVLRNCLVAGNTASTSSAALYIYHGTTTVEGCTITDNLVDPGASSTSPGGIYINQDSNDMFNIVNCIIYGNASASGSYSNMSWHGLSRNIIISNTCVAPLPASSYFTVTNSFPDDPALGSDYQLTTGSICINAGTNQPWMADARDIKGRARLDRFSGLVDIGCQEYISQGALFQIH